MKKKIFAATLIFIMTVTSFTATAQETDSENTADIITENNEEKAESTENAENLSEETVDKTDEQIQPGFSDVKSDDW